MRNGKKYFVGNKKGLAARIKNKKKTYKKKFY